MSGMHEKNNSKSHLKSITMLIINIILCVSLMIGSTFALFTRGDDIKIDATAAVMGVNLYYTNKDAHGVYKQVDAVESDVNILGELEWEPGATTVVFFKVENKSTIPVKYVLRFDTEIGTLGGAVEYCSWRSEYNEDLGSDWDELSTGKQVLDLADGFNSIYCDTYLYMDINGYEYYAVAIHMKESTGNDYQGGSATVRVILNSVQGNVDH